MRNPTICWSLDSRWRRYLGCAVLLLLSVCAPLRAQEPDTRGFVSDVTRRVVADPTTYAPAIVFFPSQYLDWASSQPFFRNGYVERNYDFTVSGRPNDVPIGFGAGNRKIVRNALGIFATSAVHNLTENILERQLVTKYPQRRKLIRTLGWIERIAAQSYLAYYTSAPHYRQWKDNERRARELGFK